MKFNSIQFGAALVVATLSAAVAQNSYAQNTATDGREGHGGETTIGPEYYSIAYRLIQSVPEQPLANVLKSAYSIRPTTDRLEFQPGVVVDALSFESTEDGNPVNVTRVQSDRWAHSDCKSKHLLVLHEMLVLLKVEQSLSYTISTPIIDRLASERKIDCQVLAMKTGCQPAYVLKGNSRDKRNDTLIKVGAYGGIVVAAAGVLAGTATLAPVLIGSTAVGTQVLGVLLYPAGAIGGFAGGINAALSLDTSPWTGKNTNKFYRVAQLLNEAETNRKVVPWFLKDMAQKNRSLRSMTSDQVHETEVQIANILAEGNQKQTFCPMDVSGKAVKLFRPNDLVKYVSERLK